MSTKAPICEGEYNETEKAIRALLAENGVALKSNLVTNGDEKVPASAGQSPETYLGLARAARYQGNPELTNDTKNYKFSNSLLSNGWTLSGSFSATNELLTTKQDNAHLKYKFNAKEVYLVMGSADGSPKSVSVKVNGQLVSDLKGEDVNNTGILTVNGARLYRLVKSPTLLNDAELELSLPSGVNLNAFTFGG